jgi:hypothetical protein
MLRQLIKEILIVCAGTLVLLILCGTVGISTSKRNDAPIVIAQEQCLKTSKLEIGQSPDGMDRALGQGDN